MAASRPKKLKKKLKKGAASRRQKAKKPCFYLFIRLKKNPGVERYNLHSGKLLLHHSFSSEY